MVFSKVFIQTTAKIECDKDSARFRKIWFHNAYCIFDILPKFGIQDAYFLAIFSEVKFPI